MPTSDNGGNKSPVLSVSFSPNAKRVLRYMFMWHDQHGKMTPHHIGSMLSLPGNYTGTWVEEALNELQSLGYVHQVKEGESWNNFQRGCWGINWREFHARFGSKSTIPSELM